MAVCGWAIRRVSLIIESRKGVSDSHNSRGMVLRCEDKESFVEVVGSGLEARRASISAFAFALHSGCPPKNVKSQQASERGDI